MNTKINLLALSLFWTLVWVSDAQGEAKQDSSKTRATRASPSWPLLLLTLKTGDDNYKVVLFDPQQGVQKPISSGEGLQKDGLGLDHPVAVGSQVTGIVCYEQWTFGCKTLSNNRTVKLNVLIGVDDEPAHAKHKLHLDMNPYDGAHVMYLEPIRQAVWIVNLQKNLAKLISTFDDENVVHIKVDWANGLLFTMTSSSISIHRIHTNNLELQEKFAANATYLASDTNGRLLYWTDVSGSVFKRPYDQPIVELVAKSACRIASFSPLYFHGDSIICLQKVDGVLTLERLGSTAGTKTLRISEISAENLIHFNIYTSKSSDSADDQIHRVCEKCSHLCVPAYDNTNRFECACPYGFALVPGDKFNCENPQVLAIGVNVATMSSKQLFRAPNEATHALLLHDFMSVPPSTRTFAFEQSLFHIVLSDRFERLCLHFPSNNSVECFSPLVNPSDRFVWTSLPGDQVMKVTGNQETGFDVYFYRQDCLRVLRTKTNRTYSLDCQIHYEATKTFVDHLGGKLYAFDTDGLNVIDSENPKIGVYSSLKMTEESPNRQLFVDSYNGTALVFPGKHDLLVVLPLNSSDNLLRRVGFESKHTQILIHRNHIFYVDDSRIVVMDRKYMAGAEFLKTFTKLQVEFTVLENQVKTLAPMGLSDPCLGQTECSHLCKSNSSESYKCWCPYYFSFKGSDVCEPTDFNVLEVDGNGNALRMSTIRAGDFGPGKQIQRQLPDIRHSSSENLFVHEPSLQRICIAQSHSNWAISCTTYGENPINTQIKTDSKPILHMVKVPTSSARFDASYWISQILLRSSTKLCLNVGSPQRNHSLQLACFPENIMMQQPHYIPDSKTLIWFKTSTDGTCAVRSLQLTHESSNLTEITDVKFSTGCLGMTLNSNGSKAYILTKSDIYELDTSTRSKTLVAPSPSNALNIIRVLGDFVFVTGLRGSDGLITQISVIGPINSPEMMEKVAQAIIRPKTTIVDFHFDSDEKLYEKTAEKCDSMSCGYHCEKMSDTYSTCVCPLPLEGAPDFGLQYEPCAEEVDGFQWARLFDTDWLVPIGILVLLCLVVIGNMCFYVRIRRRQNFVVKLAIDEALRNFIDGNEALAKQSKKARDAAIHLPFTSIIPPDLLKTTDTCLGEGQFGKVYKGEYQEKPVAVKTIKDNFNNQAICDFLKELKIMAYVGLNEHIVQFFGADISEVRRGRIRVVLEFCTRGSLESVLRRFTSISRDEQDLIDFGQSVGQSTSSTTGNRKEPRRHSVAFTNTNAENAILIDLSTSAGPRVGRCRGSNCVHLNQLLSWARQIARGMDYLEQKNVVHGDLATRNVLVCDDMTVKICDFGFAKEVYQARNYGKNTPCKLPWRWASPETLNHFTFSFKADVWSYGVTVWEIFTLGAVPFPECTWDHNFVNRIIMDGLRPPLPHQMPSELYQRVLMACWDIVPANRPSFSVLADSWYI